MKKKKHRNPWVWDLYEGSVFINQGGHVFIVIKARSDELLLFDTRPLESSYDKHCFWLDTEFLSLVEHIQLVKI
jgi:hypothetical protein